MTTIEHYDGVHNQEANVYYDHVSAQTFTIGATGLNLPAKIESVSLCLSQTGGAGQVGVQLYAVDGNNNPTGPALSNGTVPVNITGPPDYYNVIMSPQYTMQPDTKYALFLYAPEGDEDNSIQWCLNASGTYAGGNWRESVNSGTNWTIYEGQDCLFFVFGRYQTDSVHSETIEAVAGTPTEIEDHDRFLAVPISNTRVKIIGITGVS